MPTAPIEHCKNRAALSDLENVAGKLDVFTNEDREKKQYIKWLTTNLEIGAMACRACKGTYYECGISEAMGFMDSQERTFLEDKGFLCGRNSGMTV